ncbi:hypothetical protein U1Q18_046680, partial [Sarracenia purpurea var. burkii]
IAVGSAAGVTDVLVFQCLPKPCSCLLVVDCDCLWVAVCLLFASLAAACRSYLGFLLLWVAVCCFCSCCLGLSAAFVAIVFGLPSAACLSHSCLSC